MRNLLNLESVICGKMKHIIKYMTLSFFLLGIISEGCERVNELYSDNREMVREVKLKPYDYVRIWSVCNIRLVQDTACKVLVKGRKSVVENISFRQEEKRVLVGEEHENQWYRGTEKPLLEFHFNSLRYFRIEEPAHLWSEDTIHTRHLSIIAANELSNVDLMLDAKSVYLENWTTNTGGYQLSGKCSKLHVKLFGSGKLQAEKLNTSHAIIEQHSIGNGYLSVKDTLEVYSESKGNVYYSGNPEKIIFKQHASGKLIRME